MPGDRRHSNSRAGPDVRREACCGWGGRPGVTRGGGRGGGGGPLPARKCLPAGIRRS